MDRMGYTSAMVTGDPHLEKTVAQAARIGQRSLHEALLNKDTLVSINTERDDGTGIEIVDKGASPETQVELKEDIFPILHKAVLLMSLEEKEKTRAYCSGPRAFWAICGKMRPPTCRNALAAATTCAPGEGRHSVGPADSAGLCALLRARTAL